MKAERTNPKAIEFLVGLELLMRKYDVSFQITEEYHNYEVMAKGMDINCSFPEWDGCDYFEIDSRYIVAGDIHNILVTAQQNNLVIAHKQDDL